MLIQRHNVESMLFQFWFNAVYPAGCQAMLTHQTWFYISSEHYITMGLVAINFVVSSLIWAKSNLATK